jgi:glycosyltransferase involved in cell wall biosynthesis
MRVLMISEPGRYGVLVYVRNLIRFLHDKHPEITVDYAYSSVRGSADNEALVKAVRERGGETFDMRVANAPAVADVSAARGIADLVRCARPDVVHAHSSKAGALARGLRVFGTVPPVLYSPHGYYGMTLRRDRKEALFNGVERVLGQREWTHNVSLHERAFARRTLHLPEERTLLIFSGVELDRFCPVSPERKAELRRHLGLPAEARLLVTLGRDVFEKNYADLYTALREILPTLPDVHFAHAGDGSVELKRGLGEAFQSRVTAFPFLNEPEHLLQAADGFVLPSRTEAFGLAAFEALGCGVPVILTATMGFLTLKELGFSGIRWLPNPAESGSVAKPLGEAVRDWAETRNESPPDRAKLERWFRSSTQFEKLTGVYRALAETGRLVVKDWEDLG